MIKLTEQTRTRGRLICTNCQNKADVKIISIQHDDGSSNIIPLCRDCRAYLMELLLCDVEGKADSSNSNSNNEEE